MLDYQTQRGKFWFVSADLCPVKAELLAESADPVESPGEGCVT